MQDFEDFFERPAVRKILALSGIFLALLGVMIMTHAKDVRINGAVGHASKVIEMVIPNWPWRNTAGELLLPGMDPNSRGLKLLCEHGGIYLGRWPWVNQAGRWKWPWN